MDIFKPRVTRSRSVVAMVVVMAAISMLAVSCGAGVSQEDHDALITRVEAQASELASLQAAQEAPTRTVKPAEQISIAEISRHASDIPDSASYTLHDKGSS